jgi:hypothetical protein
MDEACGRAWNTMALWMGSLQESMQVDFPSSTLPADRVSGSKRGGAVPGDDLPELVPLATRVTEPLRRAVKARAAMEGRSVQNLVSQALGEYLENHDEPETSPAASPVTPRT